MQQQQHAHVFANQRVPVEVVSNSGRSRPVSAQRRRPSFSVPLGAIPENRSLVQTSSSADVDLVSDDVSDVSASSYDSRFPPRNIFKNHMPGWIATGLLPQVLNICFNVRWRFRRMEITCYGVEEIQFSIMNVRDIQSGEKFYFERVSDSLFVHELQSAAGDESKRGSHHIGNRLLITFTKAIDCFFIVKSMKIKAISSDS